MTMHRLNNTASILLFIVHFPPFYRLQNDSVVDYNRKKRAYALLAQIKLQTNYITGYPDCLLYFYIFL